MTIGQSSSVPWVQVLVLVGIGVAVVIVAGIVIMLVRRRALGDDLSQSPGMFLSDLREARASGQISEEEYEAARAALLGRMRQGDAPGVRPERDGGNGEVGGSGR